RSGRTLVAIVIYRFGWLDRQAHSQLHLARLEQETVIHLPGRRPLPVLLLFSRALTCFRITTWSLSPAVGVSQAVICRHCGFSRNARFAVQCQPPATPAYPK